jgi:hypothetical protein
MRRMNRLLRILPFLLLALLGVVFVACTSGGGGAINDDGTGFDLDGGARDGDADAEEEAVYQAILRTTGGDKAECSGVPALSIGAFGNPAAEPPVPSTAVPNGTKEEATVVAVFCKVAPKAGGFAVYATVGRSGTTFELEADVDAQGASTAAGVTLIGPNGTWSSETCTLTQTGPQMGVANGRYWATFSCPGATSTENVSCDLSGEVRLENCDEKE